MQVLRRITAGVGGNWPRALSGTNDVSRQHDAESRGQTGAEGERRRRGAGRSVEKQLVVGGSRLSVVVQSLRCGPLQRVCDWWGWERLAASGHAARARRLGNLRLIIF